MALAETAKLVASLELKDHFTPAANKAMASLGKLETRAFRVGQQIGKGFQNAARNIRNIGIVAAAGIAVAVRGGVQSLAELEDATTSVDGSIKQMGLTGKVTSQQIATWANEIEANVQAAFDDKAIVAATSTLLRFGKVTTDNIRPAMEVITDLATKTGDVDSAASLLAKALADPTKAAGKLARQGVILTKEQQKQITAFVKAGKVGKAQKVILDSLATSTKGAAAASAGPYRDALNIMSDVTEDAQRALGIGFLPVISKVAKLLSGELAKKSTIDGLKAFGESLAGGLDSAIEIARNLPWATIGDSLRIAGAGAKAVLTAFTNLPPWVQTAVLTGWGLNKLTGGALSGIVKELAGGLIKGVLGINAGVVNLRAGTVIGGGGGPGIPGGIPGAGAGAAAAAGGIGLGTIAVLAIAPASIAALGIAIKHAVDPQGIKQREGVAATASARGVPDWNNKALQELAAIKQNTLPRNTSGSPDERQARNDLLNKVDSTTTAVETMKGNLSRDLNGSKTAITAAAGRTTQAATVAGMVSASASRAAGNQVAAAVFAARPIVNTYVNVSATTVSQKTTVIKRYGATSGDRNSDEGSGLGPGGK